MKVVDMFAAGLPCLAIGGYPSVQELVKDGTQEDGKRFGMLFLSSEELAEQIQLSLDGFDATNQTGCT